MLKGKNSVNCARTIFRISAITVVKKVKFVTSIKRSTEEEFKSVKLLVKALRTLQL